MVASILARIFGYSEYGFLALLVVGVLAGITTALIGWIPAQPEVTGLSKWILTNLVGIPIAVVVAFMVFSINATLAGLLLGGLCAGVIASTFQALAVEDRARQIGPVVVGTTSWMLATTIGSLLVSTKTGSNLAFNVGQFMPILLLGWSIAGVLLILVLIGLTVRLKAGYPRGRIRWW